MENTGPPEEYIELALEHVREYYGDDVRAWLVGSRVDGEPGPDSDLDVIVETVPTNQKHIDDEALGQGFGAGRIIQDTSLGFDLDITEDEDGPIWRDDGSQVRIQ